MSHPVKLVQTIILNASHSRVAFLIMQAVKWQLTSHLSVNKNLTVKSWRWNKKFLPLRVARVVIFYHALIFSQLVTAHRGGGVWGLARNVRLGVRFSTFHHCRGAFRACCLSSQSSAIMNAARYHIFITIVPADDPLVVNMKICSVYLIHLDCCWNIVMEASCIHETGMIRLSE